MPAWTAAKVAGFTASESAFGPYLLAAYGQPGGYCWEVALGGRNGPMIAHGEAATLTAAQDAAERAALSRLAGDHGADPGQLPRHARLH